MKIDSSIIPEHILKLMSPEDRPQGKAGMLRSEIVTFQQVKNERKLQLDIANYLRLRGIIFCQPRSDKRSSMTLGWPDFSFAINGKAIAFEVKTVDGKVKEHQEKCHDQMRKNGWNVYIIRSLEKAVDTINEEMKL